MWRAYDLDRGAETNFKYKKKDFSFVTKKKKKRERVRTAVDTNMYIWNLSSPV